MKRLMLSAIVVASLVFVPLLLLVALLVAACTDSRDGEAAGTRRRRHLQLVVARSELSAG